MADENININVNLELKNAKAELAAARQAFGELSQEAINAAQKVGELKDNISDARAQAEIFTGGGSFKAITGVLSGVAGGFSAIQGAIGLVSTDSKALQETMLKVQSAMALTQGLTAVEDLGNSLKNLKTVAITSFNAIKGAIGSTGIGLLMLGLAAAIAAVIANLDELKVAFGGVSKEVKDFTEELDKSFKKLQQQGKDAIITATLEVQELKNAFNDVKSAGIDATSVFDDIKKKLPELAALKLSDANAQDKINEALNRYNTLLGYQTELTSNINTLKQLELDLTKTTELFVNSKSEADKKSLNASIDGLFAQINATRERNTELNKLVAGLQTQRNAEITTANATIKAADDVVKKEEERKRKREAEAEKEKQRLKKLEEDRKKIAEDAAFEVSKIGKTELAQQIADIERSYKDRLAIVVKGSQAEKDLIKLKEAEIAKATNDAAEKAKEKAKADTAEALSDEEKALEARFNLLQASAVKEIENQEDLDKALLELEIKKLQEQIALQKKYGQDTTALELQLAEKTKEIGDKAEEDEKARQERIKEARQAQIAGAIETATAIFDAANAVQEAQKQKEIEDLKAKGLSEEEAAKQTDEINKKYFEKNKGVQIGQAIIQTLQSSVSAFSSLAAIPVVGPALGAVAAAAALVSGYATVDKIRNTSYTSTIEPEAAGSKFADGGMLQGPSHSMGGIKTAMGELEGGEFVINKRSTANFLPLIQAINEQGKSNSNAGAATSETPIFKTYVVSSEMSSQQEANKRVSDIARL